MGEASRVMPGMLQSDSLSTGLPIENSPPGIHTIPCGAAPGAGPALEMVGAKPDVSADISDSLVKANSQLARPGWPDHRALTAYTVPAVVTTASTSNQPVPDFRFELLFGFIRR